MFVTRRQLLHASGLGLGSVALEWLLRRESVARTRDGEASTPHFRPRARAVIMLVQNGGPSQMDLFDPKPELTKHHGKVHDTRVEMFQKGSEANKLMASPLKFRKYGRCGMDMAEILPHLGSVADELCMVRSMASEHNNHTEALVLLNTGKIFPGRPALGSWISYALGSENRNLPAYVVLRDPDGYNTSGSLLWQNGWLPAVHRGTEVATRGSPVLNLKPSRSDDAPVSAADMEFLRKLNELHLQTYPRESELDARIRNFELAARMQLAAADLLDMSKEPASVRKLYGLDNPTTAGYGLRCLMARRLVEAGVRFVQIFPPVKPQFQPWDAHSNVKSENEGICAKCDQPSAALILDLKNRGLLDDTIVLWSGEFGRLPVSQNGTGRDHNRNAFTLLLAGGGFRRGLVFGATDEVGYKAVQNRVTVPDLHATLLHQLGLNHDQLVHRHHGSDESLTDSRVTKARVIRELIA